MSFHEIRFPTRIALGSQAGPERRTDIVVLGSGHEERNARWADSRRRFNAGYGIKTLNDLHDVISFFEERRGRLYGFRWRDQTDFKSCLPSETPAASDQVLGVGDGETATFQLIKTYGKDFTPYVRRITKPVENSLLIAIDNITLVEGSDYIVNYSTGEIALEIDHVPSNGATVTAGYEFDVPVRFDTDYLEIQLSAFRAGEMPNIPIVEIRL